ncbi:hypothetical protein E0K83_12725 [Gramella sp. BOM4]|nr:hypothetical protein [Christiangramia bathymodioli]
MDKTSLATGFIAINTDGFNDLERWYAAVLGFDRVKRFKSKDRLSSGVILKKDGFILEIITPNGQMQNNPIKKNEAAKSKGILKFGIFTSTSLDELKTCLTKAGINSGRIFHDKELEIRLLLLEDPDGNMIEIINKA